MQPKIDKELLPMKAHYFLFNAGTAPVVPFMPQLAQQLGYSSIVVGTMYTILPIVGLLAKPLFGYIADRYNRHRFLFLGGQLITALTFFMIMFVPATEKLQPEFHCHGGVSNIQYCANYNDNTKKNLESYLGNRSVNCEMHCYMEPLYWDIVCENWLKNQTNNCESNQPKSWVDFTTFISGKHINEEPNGSDKCLYFLIPHGMGILDSRNVTLYCPKNKHMLQSKCKIDCGDGEVKKKLSEITAINTRSAIKKPEFWFFFGMLIVSWAGMAVVVSIGDAICFGILGERHHLYGRQRLCGSLGWGIFALLAGFLVDTMSDNNQSEKNYAIVFWMTLVILGFDMLASTKLKHTQTHMSSHILKDVGHMFFSMRCVVFFLWCVAIGLCTALIWNFLFIYLEELAQSYDKGNNFIKTLEGLVMSIQCFGGELPFFFMSGWILKRIGHVNAMSLVLLGFGVRFILYSMLQNPWYVLPIELLNGVTFGLFYATMASYASIVAPPGTEATMQSLVGAIFEGVGVSIGSQIAGQLFVAISARTTFEVFGIGAFIVFIIHVCVQMYLKHNGPAENGKGRAALRTTFASPSTVTNTANGTDYPASNKSTDGFCNVDLS